MTRTSLHLRIINMTSLPDGGPLEASVAPGGMLEAGRDSGLDWCLPDSQRFISSRHFEIRSEKGGWMLYDLSTNGTFVNGASSRVKSPCPLHDGDRLQVGQYSIEISTRPAGPADAPEETAAPAPEPAAPRPAARSLPGGADPWAVGAPAAPPTPSGTGADIWSMPSAPASPAGWPQMPEQSPVPPQQTAPPVAAEAPPFVSHATAAAPASAAAAPLGAAPTHSPDAQALLETIETAAGLAAGTLSRGDAQATAQEIGATLRALTEELSSLLQARAVARRSVRSAQVTMIGREDNNPLKFMPTPDQALAIMFGTPRPGFQRGAAAVRSGFADIKSHQYATHAALQPALAQLLEELAPDAIEKRLEGVRLNRKSRAWETYVERWDAKTRNHENGMLDVFLALYAEAYDRESGRG